MSPDLHTPLGQTRGKSKRRPLRGRLLPLFGYLTAVVIVGFSTYSAITPLALTGSIDGEEKPLLQTDAASGSSILTQKSQASGNLQSNRPTSGANVERQTLPDGSTVTKFSPLSRPTDGPVLIDTPRVGQDPRIATMPNEDLLEDSVYGGIPTVGADGTRPVDQYARPWSGARGARIAIVIGGMGLSQTGSQNAIRVLPPEITLAFASAGNSLQRWMQAARQGGHEILLQVPFEPFDYPANDPGRGTLLTTASANDNLDNLHQAMASITNYTGVMNYMGGKFLSDADALEPIMRDIAGRGLLFLDDGSSASSLTGEYAKALNEPHAFADLQIDQQLDRTAILKRLDELENIARREGTAIGVGSAFDETVDAVREWSEEAERRGIEIVGVSAVATEGRP
ncbi:divergent polysaccharide deacetylase family protein [Agrobacterium sp. ES01]|uniref:divergent polysaccharide deacetylase family protein n=1 Tax=Agrobacterium sp. ES01 TaxID=3420714 RepID=UPI003D0ABB58